MTLEEAISCLKADKEYLKDHNICDGEEIDAAIEALEKQIPKKPIMIKDTAETYYICSECEMEVDKFDDNYCSDCGQKLDWSSEE